MREKNFAHHGAVLTGLLAIGTACIALAGCGGGGMPADSVAEVDGHVITKQDLDHWTSVQFAVSYNPRGQQPVPRGVVPDPPQYTACIIRLREVLKNATFPAPDTVKTVPLTSAPALKKKCEAELRRVREHVLNVLIVFDWYIGEGERQGFHLSEAEVRREYGRFSREMYQHEGSLQRYLKNTGQSYGDELLRMEIDLLSTKFYDKGIKQVGGLKTPAQEKAFIRWGAGFPSTWKSRTSCRAGYVVQNCKEYKGGLPPDPRI